MKALADQSQLRPLAGEGLDERVERRLVAVQMILEACRTEGPLSLERICEKLGCSSVFAVEVLNSPEYKELFEQGAQRLVGQVLVPMIYRLRELGQSRKASVALGAISRATQLYKVLGTAIQGQQDDWARKMVRDLMAQMNPMKPAIWSYGSDPNLTDDDQGTTQTPPPSDPGDDPRHGGPDPAPAADDEQGRHPPGRAE